MMIHLDLSDAERDALKEILESTLSDLRMEISHTDRLAFRDMLRERKGVLQKTLDALGSVSAGA